jgi:hypothetical protein
MLRVGTIGNLISIAALCIVVFIFMMAIRPGTGAERPYIFNVAAGRI